MRIAVVSDVHGSLIALDSVLADVDRHGGVDVFWFLGDLAAFGPDPAGAMDRLTALPEASFVRGNTDRLTLIGLSEAHVREHLARAPEHLGAVLEESATLGWTRGRLTPGHLDWLAALPLELRTTLPDGTRVLCVHAAPGTDDGDGIRPTVPDGALAAILAEANADLVFVGHTHWPLDRTAGGVRVVNPGSVSNPEGEDVRAKYVLLTADEAGYEVHPCRAEYDNAAVIAAVEAARHPSAAYITSCMRGESTPSWMDRSSAPPASPDSLPPPVQ